MTLSELSHDTQSDLAALRDLKPIEGYGKCRYCAQPIISYNGEWLVGRLPKVDAVRCHVPGEPNWKFGVHFPEK